MSKTFIDGNNCVGERVRSQRRQMSLGPRRMPDIVDKSGQEGGLGGTSQMSVWV